MKVGFTGTQRGMTPAQSLALAYTLDELPGGEFHHGDCIGADAEAHDIAAAAGFEIVLHPPIKADKRAFKTAAQSLPAKDYLARNKDIVAATDVLIATPAEPTEQQRSGTWSTVRHARKLGRRIILILPDGSVR